LGLNEFNFDIDAPVGEKEPNLELMQMGVKTLKDIDKKKQVS